MLMFVWRALGMLLHSGASDPVCKPNYAGTGDTVRVVNVFDAEAMFHSIFI